MMNVFQKAIKKFKDNVGPNGFITPVENQADSTATDVATLKGDFNDFLDKLKEAGIMAADEEIADGGADGNETIG